MALIKCKECGHEVSDKASACPNCGCPIERVGVFEGDQFEEKPMKSKGWIWALMLVLLCLIGGGYYAYAKFLNVGNKKDAIVKLTPEFVKAVQQYEQLGVFNEGMAAVKKGDKWGYINTKGEEVIPCEYISAGKFSEGYAPVSKGEGVGFINYEGMLVIPFSYEQAEPFSEGLAAVCKDEHWGFIDCKGKEVITCAYTSVSQFHDGLSLAMKEDTPIYINLQGKQAFSIPVEDPSGAGLFSCGLAFIAKDYEEFSIIDTDGKIVFSGKWQFQPSEGLQGPFLESSQLPVYVNGIISVPNEECDFDVYDKTGKKINTSIIAVPKLIEPQNKDFTYTLTFFNSENGTDYMTYGLKDDAGKILLKGIYESINNYGGSLGPDGTQPIISNGIMLVTLIEYEDDLEEGYAGVYMALPKTTYYGYADLQGHDTFTQEVKDRCRKSREKAMKKLDEMRREEQEVLETNIQPEWLQGTWTINANIMGQTKLAKLVIDGNYATFYSDGVVLDKGEYEIYDGQIHFGSTYINMDEEKQLIMYDDSHYFSHSSQPTTSVNISTPEQEKELKKMARLKELNNMSKELINELAIMRNSGRMDPARYMYIKQAVLDNKDEQIRLARQLGDTQLTYEYQQQKEKLEQAYRMLEKN